MNKEIFKENQMNRYSHFELTIIPLASMVTGTDASELDVTPVNQRRSLS